MQLMTFSQDFTLVHLKPRGWAKLVDLWSRPNKKNPSGGFQDRLAAWKASANQMQHTVLLSHARTNPRRTDDMTFIIHSIEGKLQGGWQGHIAEVFEDSHPKFTGLTVRPRKR